MSLDLRGVPVLVSSLLPYPPTPGEEARRIVRHGLADVLKWLGEDPGPKPDALTHAIMSVDPARGGASVLMTSREFAEQLMAATR